MILVWQSSEETLMLMLMLMWQCSKEILPSQQFLVLDPGKVVIRSDHLAPAARNRGIWIFSAPQPHVLLTRIDQVNVTSANNESHI